MNRAAVVGLLLVAAAACTGGSSGPFDVGGEAVLHDARPDYLVVMVDDDGRECIETRAGDRKMAVCERDQPVAYRVDEVAGRQVAIGLTGPDVDVVVVTLADGTVVGRPGPDVPGQFPSLIPTARLGHWTHNRAFTYAADQPVTAVTAG